MRKLSVTLLIVTLAALALPSATLADKCDCDPQAMVTSVTHGSKDAATGKLIPEPSLRGGDDFFVMWGYECPYGDDATVTTRTDQSRIYWDWQPPTSSNTGHPQYRYATPLSALGSECAVSYWADFVAPLDATGLYFQPYTIVDGCELWSEPYHIPIDPREYTATVIPLVVN